MFFEKVEYPKVNNLFTYNRLFEYIPLSTC